MARGLRRCFGQRAGVVTAFAANEIGLLMEDLILQGGVDTALISKCRNDGLTCVGANRNRSRVSVTQPGFALPKWRVYTAVDR